MPLQRPFEPPFPYLIASTNFPLSSKAGVRTNAESNRVITSKCADRIAIRSPQPWRALIEASTTNDKLPSSQNRHRDVPSVAGKIVNEERTQRRGVASDLVGAESTVFSPVGEIEIGVARR